MLWGRWVSLYCLWLNDGCVTAVAGQHHFLSLDRSAGSYPDICLPMDFSRWRVISGKWCGTWSCLPRSQTSVEKSEVNCRGQDAEEEARWAQSVHSHHSIVVLSPRRTCSRFRWTEFSRCKPASHDTPSKPAVRCWCSGSSLVPKRPHPNGISVRLLCGNVRYLSSDSPHRRRHGRVPCSPGVRRAQRPLDCRHQHTILLYSRSTKHCRVQWTDLVLIHAVGALLRSSKRTWGFSITTKTCWFSLVWGHSWWNVDGTLSKCRNRYLISNCTRIMMIYNTTYLSFAAT